MPTHRAVTVPRARAIAADQPALSGDVITKLMRAHRRTIAGLAASMGITQARVRHVRVRGVAGRAYAMDWLEAITGDPHYPAQLDE